MTGGVEVDMLGPILPKVIRISQDFLRVLQNVTEYHHKLPNEEA